MADAIDEMAKRAAEENLCGAAGAAGIALEAEVIARHYREGVRELVLAARELSKLALIEGETGECVCCGKLDGHKHDCQMERLAEALEGFSDVK